MSLSEQIQKDIVAAMKAKEEMRLSVLRMVKAALQLKEVEKLRKLDQSESIQLLQSLVKQRKESIDQFTKGGRQDLVDKENAELKILETYLPAGATEAERRGIGREVADRAAHPAHQDLVERRRHAAGGGGELRDPAAVERTEPFRADVVAATVRDAVVEPPLDVGVSMDAEGRERRSGRNSAVASGPSAASPVHIAAIAIAIRL